MECNLDVNSYVFRNIEETVGDIGKIDIHTGIGTVNQKFGSENLGIISKLNEAFKEKVISYFAPTDNDLPGTIKVTLSDRIYKYYLKKYGKGSKIKEGVSEVFESNPELLQIGTQQQYSQYLDTIFPDSKVKEIFLHSGSVNKNDKFNRSKIGPYSSYDLFYFSHISHFKKIKTKEDLFKYYLPAVFTQEDKQAREDSKTIDELEKSYLESDAFTKNTQKNIMLNNISELKQNINNAFERVKNKYLGGWYKSTYDNLDNLIFAILDIKSPYTEEHIENFKSEKNKNTVKTPIKGDPMSTYILNENFDSYSMNKNMNSDNNIGVKQSEQIHILGSKQDIEGFNFFVNKDTIKNKEGGQLDLFNQNISKIDIDTVTLSKSGMVTIGKNSYPFKNVTADFLESLGYSISDIGRILKKIC